MDKDKTLRQALEALEQDRTWLESWAPKEVWDKNKEAITAIKQALANDALDRMADNERELGIQMQPDVDQRSTESKETFDQPEPVAIGYMNAGHVHEMQQGRLPHGYVYPKGSVGADVAVYTSPPKRKPLTDDELKPICDEYRILFGYWVNDFARAIEAKLKEKNT